MRIAIITVTDKELVSFPEPTFRELLKKYLAENNNDVDKAMDKIITDLKQLTITA